MPPAAILVVDDDPDMRDLEREALQMDGYDVETASNGEAALEALKRRPFDLVVSDMQMPLLDGIGLYRKAILLDAGLARDFIFVTGSALTDEARDFARITGVPVLAKPFSIATLRRSVRQALEKSSLQQ